MRHYDASSVIAASPGRDVLCDGRHWPEWDSGVGAVEGSITPGETIIIRSREEDVGPLLGLMWRSMPDLGPSFTRFAEGVKQRVEAGG